MSRIAIVDLQQADTLSATRMGQVAGGIDCGSQSDVAHGLWDLRDSFNNLGFTGAADAVDDQARDILSGPCTV